MSTIKHVAQNSHFTATHVGKLDQLSAHTLVHAKSGRLITGKVFLKESTQATGTEISYNALPPHTDVPYFHTHHKNEETYLILKGEGFFQVDEECFEISEGSVVRIAPAGKRGLTNTSDEEMIYLVIQSKEGSLEEYSSEDGKLVDAEAKWK